MKGRRKLGHRLLLAPALVMVAAGCVGLRPTSDASTTRFSSFESAREAFAEIVPGTTSADDLRALRIDPAEPGVRLASPIRAASYFTSYPEAPRELQPPAVRRCLEAGPRCRVWLVSQERISRRRIGNLLLDVLRFRRLRHTTGWRIEGFVFLLDDVVVYSLWRGEPRIDEMKDDVRPLGFLQEGPRVEFEGFRRPRVALGDIVGEERGR